MPLQQLLSENSVSGESRGQGIQSPTTGYEVHAFGIFMLASPVDQRFLRPPDILARGRLPQGDHLFPHSTTLMAPPSNVRVTRRSDSHSTSVMRLRTLHICRRTAEALAYRAILLTANTNEVTAQREAQRMGRVLAHQRRSRAISEVDVIGPAPAYPTRVRGRYRWHLLIRGPDPRLLLDRSDLPEGWVVDVDPVSVL